MLDRRHSFLYRSDRCMACSALPSSVHLARRRYDLVRRFEFKQTSRDRYMRRFTPPSYRRRSRIWKVHIVDNNPQEEARTAWLVRKLHGLFRLDLVKITACYLVS